MHTSDNSLNKVTDFSTKKPLDYNVFFQKVKVQKNVDQTLEVKKFDEKVYFDDISKILSSYNFNKEKIKSSNLNEDKKDEELEELYEKLTHEIWHLNDSLDLPNDYRYLLWETKNVISAIKEKWQFNLGLNSFLVPWSLTSFRKVIEYWVVDSKNIEINLWNWVNIQEWIRLVKHADNWHGWAITHFDSWLDNIEKVFIKLWDNSSVAHGVVFQSKSIDDVNKYEYEYNLKTWENVFLGINAQIGSNVKIGNNVSVWWGTIIKDNVKIGDNVVIWEWVRIKHDIHIPSNSLIPNGAIIRKWFSVIKYEDYIKNQLHYDTEFVEERKRRNFIIKFDDNLSREEQISLMEWINKGYVFMAVFNELCVTPENKLFAVINTMLSIINKHFPKVWVIKEEEFKSTLSFEQVKSRMPEMEDELIINELKRPIKLSLKAFPKNKAKFLSEIIPEVIDSIKTWKDITDKIKSYLDYPEIPKNKEEVFLWTNTITWKSKINGNSLVYDTYIRSDETAEVDKVEINNSVVVKWILHWGWDKIIDNSKVYCTVVHGKMLIDDTNIWNYKHHSVYHNCELDEVNQESWWIVANGVKIKKSEIWFWVLFMPFDDPKKIWIKWNVKNCKIWDYVFLGNSSLDGCDLKDRSYIWNWLHFEDLNLDWKIYWKDKHKSETYIWWNNF